METITLQVHKLDPRFTIFIDLCSCDFQAGESFTVQVNQSYGGLTFSLIVVSLLMN